MNPHQLLSYFQERQDEMLTHVRELVTRETPSTDKPRLDAFAQFLAERYRAVGAQAEVIANETRGDHVRARIDNGQGQGKPALVLCHFDTVWPVGSLATHPFRIEDGKA